MLFNAIGQTTEKGDLGKTCYFLSRLIEYEIKDKGFFCKIEKTWKKIPDNVYFVTKYETGNQKEIKEFENEFFKKYGIKIKFVLNENLSHKTSSFFIPKPP